MDYKPTIDEIREKMIKHEIAIVQIGRALAPVVNAVTADLSKRIISDSVKSKADDLPLSIKR